MGASIIPCLFCGQTGKKLTIEDVYPNWLHTELGLDNFSLSLVSGPDRQLVRRTAKLESRLRDVCEDCNQGWMSDLESGFKTLMAPALHGMPVTLDKDDRRVVALWATKQWLLLMRAGQYLQHSPMLPAVEQFRWLYEHREPAQITQIWLGRVILDDSFVTWNSAQVVGVPPDPPLGILGVFQIATLLFAVYIPEVNKGKLVAINLPGGTGDYWVQIWPNVDGVGAVGWPPVKGVPASLMEKFWPSHHLIQPVVRPSE